MEKLNEVWQIIMPYVTNSAVMGVIATILGMIIKSAINKKFNDKDMTKLMDKSFDKTIGQVQGMTFTHDIQPLVESALQVYNERALETIKEDIKLQHEIAEKQTELINKLVHFFDDSINVSDQKLAEAQAIYEEAIALCNPKPLIVESVVKIAEPKKKEEPKEVVGIER